MTEDLLYAPMPNDVQTLLATPEDELEQRWQQLADWIQARFKREASIETVLFLIGIQVRGRGFEPRLEKEVKQSYIMEGTYAAFATLGHYAQVGMDAHGAWIWEKQVTLPTLTIEAQEKLLRLAILRYFNDYLD